MISFHCRVIDGALFRNGVLNPIKRILNHPIEITIAPHGQAVTQSPHPTHILFESSIGGS